MFYVFLRDKYDIPPEAFTIVVAFSLTSGVTSFAGIPELERKTKDRILPVICSAFGNLKWHKYRCNLPGDIFEESAFVKPCNWSSFDDVFEGEYKDVKYQIIEGEFRKVYGTGEYEAEITLFKGVILNIDMNKDFTSHTIIQADTPMHISPSSKLKHTELEDIVFERKFDVFTNDEIEARYLITTSFMQRLNDVQIAFGANIFKCVFYKHQLIIGLSTSKNLFEPVKPFKPLNDLKQVASIFDELYAIISLIDHFKLNQKIGL